MPTTVSCPSSVSQTRWGPTARAETEALRAGPPGLLTEEFDVTQRQLRGNLPQAFVHALLLEASTTLTPLEARPSTTTER
jgi:hypothetical protein